MGVETAESIPGAAEETRSGGSAAAAVGTPSGRAAIRDLRADTPGCSNRPCCKTPTYWNLMIEPRQRSWKSGSLALLLLAAFALLVLAPLAMMFGDMLPGGTVELDATRSMLRDQSLQHIILRTLAVALLACGLASVLAIPAAFVVVHSGTPVRILFQVIGFLPLTMPPFVSAALLKHFTAVAENTAAAPLLAGFDVQGNSIALILVFALHYLPFILFSLVAGLTEIDRSLAESARNLGAGPVFIWRRITLPLATPAYVVGATLMVLRILEDVGTPLILGIEGMLAPQILMRLGAAGLTDPLLNASALVLFGLSVAVAALAWSALIDPPGPGGLKPCRGQTPRSGAGIGVVIGLPLLLVLGMLALAPHLWLLLMSIGSDWSAGLLPQRYTAEVLQQSLAGTLPGLKTTLAYAAGAGLLTLLISVMFAMPSGRQIPFTRAVRLAANALFAIPGVVLALAYVYMQGLLDSQLVAWSGLAWLALMLVVALKQLPLARHLVARRLRELHAGELDSAYSLGATRFAGGLRITLPSLTAAFTIVFLIGFAAAVVELSAALVLINEPQALLSLHLFQSLQIPTEAAGSATQGLLLVTLNALALLLAFGLLRRHCRRPAGSPAHNPAAARKDP
jgi:iron(III) transport system permease protein